MKRVLISIAVIVIHASVAAAQALMPDVVPQPGIVAPAPRVDIEQQQGSFPAAPPGVQVPFPNFQIDPECAREAGGPMAGKANLAAFENCRIQQVWAHNQLLYNWPNIPTSVILSCMSLARGTGFGSYPVLATCIAPQFRLQ